MSKNKSPYNINELKSMEMLARKGIPVSKEKHMKLIEFAKNFAEDPSEAVEIVKSRGTKLQREALKQKAEEKAEDKATEDNNSGE